MQPVTSLPIFLEDIPNLHDAPQTLMPPKSNCFIKRASEWPERDERTKATRYVGMEGENCSKPTIKAVVFLQKQERAAITLGLSSPLGFAVVYDSTVHGSWKAMRDRTNAQSGSVAALGEQAWIAAYVATRREWLATSPRPDLRRTVYRMDAFQRLIDQGFWGLELPLVVRGAEISVATLSATPPGCYDGPQPGTRSLALQSPMARGLDARLVQLGLSDRGADIKADGIFGQTSVKRLSEYLQANGLPATGVADPALIAQLVS